MYCNSNGEDLQVISKLDVSEKADFEVSHLLKID